MFGKMDKHCLTAKKSSLIRLRLKELYSIVMILEIFFCSFCGAQNVISACSNTDTGKCNFFNFSCSEARDKIQIIFAKYRIRKMSTQSMTSQRHNRAVPAVYQNTERRCPVPPNVCISPLACCRNPQNYEDKPYSAGHLYSLLDQCSYRDNCVAKAQYNTPYNATSISCSVSYRCVAEAKVVKFCQESTLTATEIHIVFENTMLANTMFENNINPDTFRRASNAMCWCVLRSSEKYTVRAQDFRFQNGTGHCTRSSSLSGFVPDKNISCSRHNNIDERLREGQVVSGDKTFELNVDLTNKPQMVWIEAKGTEQITAECFSANNRPTTAPASLSPSQKTSTTSGTTPASSVSSTTSISFSTTVTSKANDTTLTVQTSNADDTTLTTDQSSIKHPNTTEHSNYERTTEKQTAPSKNNSSVRHIHDGESGGIPVSAIVVPTVVIVLLLGVGAFVLFWRKRRMKGETTKEQRDINIIAENPKLNKTYNNAYNKPFETSGETHDYLELQPEHTYTYIDHGEVNSNDLPNIAQTFPKQAQDVNEHSENNYFILEPEAVPLPSQTFGNDKSNMEDNSALTETAGENHNYFVLEPQHTISADVSETMPTAIQTSHSDEGNYFILEPQRIVDTQSEPQEMSYETKVERTATEDLQNPDYFILESGDTYDSINPGDVTVQSLPENEYNAISLNANRIVRDPNYDALKDARNCSNIEDNGEYSHIQNTLVNTFNRQDNYYGYSH